MGGYVEEAEAGSDLSFVLTIDVTLQNHIVAHC